MKIKSAHVGPIYCAWRSYQKHSHIGGRSEGNIVIVSYGLFATLQLYKHKYHNELQRSVSCSHGILPEWNQLFPKQTLFAFS